MRIKNFRMNYFNKHTSMPIMQAQSFSQPIRRLNKVQLLKKHKKILEHDKIVDRQQPI